MELNKQNAISNYWIEVSKKIHHTKDKYNLTTFVEGQYKHAAEIDFINAMNIITPDATVLDLACGNGRLCEAFCDSVNWMTGTDLCEDFVNYLNNWKTASERKNVNFFTLDLLESDYTPFFTHSYSVIFLFGVTQCILNDEDIKKIFKNIHTILKPNGKLLVKQTTSITQNDISIDHFSNELNQHWIAKYRTIDSIEKLAHSAKLKVIKSQPIYSQQNLGEHYKNVERWDNTRQIIFEMVKMPT